MTGGQRRSNWRARLYLWLTCRLYNELAWAYDFVAWLVSLGQWSRWRKLALRHVVGQRVLEIGFGTGELLLEAHRRGIEVYGLELSPAMHRITARRMRRSGLRLPVVRADARNMPFADASFGTVVSTFPAGYILSPETLAEAARVLRRSNAASEQGGRLVILGLLVETDSALLHTLQSLINGGVTVDVLARIEQLAEDAGFNVKLAIEAGRLFRLPVLILDKKG